jgi:hypothetical protein
MEGPLRDLEPVGWFAEGLQRHVGFTTSTLPHERQNGLGAEPIFFGETKPNSRNSFTIKRFKSSMAGARRAWAKWRCGFGFSGIGVGGVACPSPRAGSGLSTKVAAVGRASKKPPAETRSLDGGGKLNFVNMLQNGSFRLTFSRKYFSCRLAPSFQGDLQCARLFRPSRFSYAVCCC